MRHLRLIVPRYPYYNVYSRISIPPVGLVFVGTAVARTGRYTVEIIDENNYRGELDHRRLQRERPADAVGLYAGMTSTAPRVYEVARLYHKLGVPVMAGGAHVTALPEEALANGVDVVVLGEGEETAVAVLDALAAGGSLAGVAGIAYAEGGAVGRTAARPPRADLDRLPTPDFSLLVNVRRRPRYVPVSRTRGCNFRCEFCAVRNQLGRTRWASPERTFEQVRELWAHGFRRFFFTDDNFAQDRAGTVTLLERIIAWRHSVGVRPRFYVQVRAEVGRDHELLRLMRRAGVTTVCLGLESPLDEDLRAMRKGQSAAAMERDVGSFRRHGFYVHGMFIFGYPRPEGAAKASLSMHDQANRYLTFIRRARIDTIQVMKPVPLPGTELARRLAAAGRIYPLSDVGWDKYDGNWVCFEPEKGTSAVDLQDEATRIMREFYRPRNLAKWLYIAPLSPLDLAYVTVRTALRSWSAYVREWRTLRHGQGRVAHLRGALRRILGESLSAGWQAFKRRWRNAFWRTGAVFVIKGWLASFHREGFRDLLMRRAAAARPRTLTPSPSGRGLG